MRPFVVIAILAVASIAHAELPVPAMQPPMIRWCWCRIKPDDPPVCQPKTVTRDCREETFCREPRRSPPAGPLQGVEAKCFRKNSQVSHADAALEPMPMNASAPAPL